MCEFGGAEDDINRVCSLRNCVGRSDINLLGDLDRAEHDEADQGSEHEHLVSQRRERSSIGASSAPRYD
jgi:hypothetical protein